MFLNTSRNDRANKKPWNSKWSIYKSTNLQLCAAIFTSEDRILHWVRSLQLWYFDPPKDNNQNLVDWINHESYDSTAFQEVEIQISKTNQEHHHHTGFRQSTNRRYKQCSSDIYLTTGIIMFQGHTFKFWAERVFYFKRAHRHLCFKTLETRSTISTTWSEQATRRRTDEDKELLQNLSDAPGTLLYKKPKLKAKKQNPVTENQEFSLTNALLGCETSLIRETKEFVWFC